MSSAVHDLVAAEAFHRSASEAAAQAGDDLAGREHHHAHLAALARLAETPANTRDELHAKVAAASAALERDDPESARDLIRSLERDLKPH